MKEMKNFIHNIIHNTDKKVNISLSDNSWKNPGISVMEQWNKKDDIFYAPGALVKVENGKGMLYEVFADACGNSSYVTLMFQDEPLFQFQGDEYFCPTCEKIVRSGYHLDPHQLFKIEKLNEQKQKVSFEEVLEEIQPVLGLLNDNYYIILDTELYPTDGNGHLFCQLPNDNRYMHGSCLYYRGDCMWGKRRPHFTVATQSTEKLSSGRVKYYREHPNCRAVAYYMDGYMTSLLDGHHKAMAAAIDHIPLSALVIIPCYEKSIRMENGSYKSCVGFDDMVFEQEKYYLEEVPVHLGKKLSASEMERINQKIPTEVDESHAIERILSEVLSDLENNETDISLENKGTDISLENMTDRLAGYYPDVEGVSYIDECKEISDEWLDEILSGKYSCGEDEICSLIRAMGALRHKRTLEIANYYFKINEYTAYPRYRNRAILTAIVDVLVSLPKTEELESYLIDMMIEIEGDYMYLAGSILESL